MVVRIKTGKNIRGALSYNEHKVSNGLAELILASKFGCDVSELGFSQKLKRFQLLMEKSQKINTNTLHISLNFSPDDIMDKEKMQMIATDYMERIGFRDQPFLVYTHFDTSHPHIHIVTTPIKINGKSINLHNLAKIKSEPARKELEIKYNLIIAASKSQNNSLPQSINLASAYYGTSETKRAITNVVSEIVSKYKFSNLDEFNAILRLFNIIADPGAKGSRQFQNRGLVYSFLDKDGFKTGIPINASSIYNKPTIATLEKLFGKNTNAKLIYQHALETKLHRVLSNSPISTSEFLNGLAKKNIACLINNRADGGIRNLYFVDHTTKAVFSSENLLAKFPNLVEQINNNTYAALTKNSLARTTNEPARILYPNFDQFTSSDLLRTLLADNSQQFDQLPYFLKRKKKKKKL